LHFNFRLRTERYIEMIKMRLSTFAATALSDVRWNGHSGATDLCGQAESLIGRKLSCDAIDVFNEHHRFLPHFEIAKRVGRRHAQAQSSPMPREFVREVRGVRFSWELATPPAGRNH